MNIYVCHHGSEELYLSSHHRLHTLDTSDLCFVVVGMQHF